MIHYPVLLPLAWLYRGLVQLRNHGYDKGIFAVRRLPARVLSVGNLTVGGTGKTPLTIFLANALQQEGRRVAIVARGYGRSRRGTCIVSDGRHLLADLHASGDEPQVLAAACPATPVIVDASKTHAAAVAVVRFQPEVVVLDDGFQHRRLHRDLDIVLAPADFLRDPAWLLPAGPWREPRHNLRRAHLLLLTGLKALSVTEQEAVQARCRDHFGVKTFALEFQPRHLRPLTGNEDLPLSAVSGCRAVLVSGIANPARFVAMVRGLGIEPVEVSCFPDHYNYRASDAHALAERLLQSRSDFLITTGKDAVKLRHFDCLHRLPAYALEIQALPSPDFLPAVRQALGFHALTARAHES
ncbi:MAG: tetraacyldisaccharide 4'-kinase [candidate division KSB1 bacterium]|nr:tetraacyldisaccharide 4'-kinase [candidate division KSB1 bacterium]MDZ7272887.1 tetraacyldisaccharide 4'-kinase [candidate division KSB1 bacterium]MDZ7284090.1 tetraacyldisaccharide 4'-kinase [candidate division KSB1 bacterium]MDZ7297512.1 tetraacyldisaccharide 4'-kinase [candidate division KSB1 bacterium]MDZ7308248.1 tetraacyldisaccharide 4'-kinase [candidate division KSB1 bacterium]